MLKFELWKQMYSFSLPSFDSIYKGALSTLNILSSKEIQTLSSMHSVATSESSDRRTIVNAEITRVYLDFNKVYVQNEFGVTSTVYAGRVREQVQRVVAVIRNISTRSVKDGVFELFPYLDEKSASAELKKFMLYNIVITAKRTARLFIRSVFLLCGAVEHMALCAKRYTAGNEFDVHPILAHLVVGIYELMFSIKAPMNGIVLFSLALYGLISDPLFASAAINMVEIKANVDLPSSSASSVFDLSAAKRDCRHMTCVDPKFTIDRACTYRDEIFELFKNSLTIAKVRNSAEDIITTSLDFASEKKLYYSIDITGHVVTKLGPEEGRSPYRCLSQKNELLRSSFDHLYGNTSIEDVYIPFASYGRLQSNHITIVDQQE